MIRSFQMFVFVFMSILEVRVRADVIVQYPDQCLKKNEYPCAVKNTSLSKNLNFNKVSLSPESIVKWESSKLISLVKGSLFVNNKSLSVSTIYTNLEVIGSAYIKYSNEVLEVESYSGEVRLSNDKSIVAGMMSVIPGFNSVGGLIVEAPRPLFYNQSVEKWQMLLGKDLGDKRKNKFKKNLDDVVNIMSDTYKKTIIRQVASYEKNLENQKKLRLERQKEIEKLNSLFKEKNYIY